MGAKKIKKRYFTKADQIRLTQANTGLRLAIDMQNALRQDRNWMADEVRRLRSILSELAEEESETHWLINGVSYERRILRTPEEQEKDSEPYRD